MPCPLSTKTQPDSPAPGPTIAQAEHDVNVQSGFATIVDSDVTDRTQHLALLGDRNFAIRYVGEIEPADCRLGECTKCSQRCGPYLLLSGKRRDDRRGLFSRIYDHDEGALASAFGDELRLHRRLQIFIS